MLTHLTRVSKGPNPRSSRALNYFAKTTASGWPFLPTPELANLPPLLQLARHR